MRILLDVDGVLADFTSGVLKWAHMQPELRDVTYDSITEFDYLKAWGHPECQFSLDAWCSEKGFCLGLPALPGAHRMVAAIRAAGHEIVIVTSPYSAAPTWCYERIQWLQSNFGFDKRDVIFAKRKELVDGDVLIDDSTENAYSFATYGTRRQAWVIDAPWNKSAWGSTIKRFYSAAHVADYVENLK